MLTDDHKNKSKASVLTFLEPNHIEGDELFDRIIRGDETSASYVNVETKDQSMQWDTFIHQLSQGSLSKLRLPESSW